MIAHHIIDIEKTDATEEDIYRIELALAAELEPASLITDGNGSMYSIYAENITTAQARKAEQFARGVLFALGFEGRWPKENE